MADSIVFGRVALPGGSDRHAKLNRMSVPSVVIAATNLMPGLRERLLDEGDLLAFADTEPIQALQAILTHKPRLVVLERLFAATPRGAALINRIKTDQQLGHAEVRVMSHTGDYSRVVKQASIETPTIAAAGASVRDAVPQIATEEAPPARQLDWHGTRRAPRYRIRKGVEIQLDGNGANVVDLSVIFRGAIAWAKFELPKPTEPPRYRAGVEFIDADGAAMEDYCNRHKL
jgi:hypothetical protein